MATMKGDPSWLGSDGGAKKFSLLFQGPGGDLFTFPIPPSSVLIAYPERLVATQTRSGIHFDDWGSGVITISIQGSTGFGKNNDNGKTGHETFSALVALWEARAIAVSKQDPDPFRILFNNLQDGMVMDCVMPDFRYTRDQASPFLCRYQMTFQVVKVYQIFHAESGGGSSAGGNSGASSLGTNVYSTLTVNPAGAVSSPTVPTFGTVAVGTGQNARLVAAAITGNSSPPAPIGVVDHTVQATASVPNGSATKLPAATTDQTSVPIATAGSIDPIFSPVPPHISPSIATQNIPITSSGDFPRLVVNNESLPIFPNGDQNMLSMALNINSHVLNTTYGISTISTRGSDTIARSVLGVPDLAGGDAYYSTEWLKNLSAVAGTKTAQITFDLISSICQIPDEAPIASMPLNGKFVV